MQENSLLLFLLFVVSEISALGREMYLNEFKNRLACSERRKRSGAERREGCMIEEDEDENKQRLGDA